MSNKMQNQNSKGCSLNDSSLQKVGYIQVGATASLKAIPKEGIEVLDIVVLAFADFNKTDTEFLEPIQEVMKKEKSETLNLLGIGGATVDRVPDPKLAVKNICAQIDKYNDQLEEGKISGVDLDLESGIPEDTINSLAKGFKEAGLIVSAAPQVYTGDGKNIKPGDPKNLVLTSGGPVNTYAKAIEKGYIDYLFVQIYNSGSFTVGGCQENEDIFFVTIAIALDNYAKKLGRIPKTTKIMIGEPANQGAGGEYTIFNPDAKKPVVEYNHEAILTRLQCMIYGMQHLRIDGIMMWSLNNDYMPKAWGDTYALEGGFSEYIFRNKSQK